MRPHMSKWFPCVFNNRPCQHSVTPSYESHFQPSPGDSFWWILREVTSVTSFSQYAIVRLLALLCWAQVQRWRTTCTPSRLSSLQGTGYDVPYFLMLPSPKLGTYRTWYALRLSSREFCPSKLFQAWARRPYRQTSEKPHIFHFPHSHTPNQSLSETFKGIIM